ncbi:MAG: hypothetical protein EPN70_03185 [Paraburkholderia sp.]|uniref:hypothetical protein n=1 Tax=Paraburkholderia sp. TaxID=1926495 RepID=UPI0011F8B34C|nr:hypothetical protein [Paraburkholderia sp.]TAM07308.1 MAG: hypothetical protein EPN70_03185 [Paraburkholderia sp.]TAM30813.1 MAG: hypothetical protein EPN59_07160 [Paraburkholderia sp.]
MKGLRRFILLIVFLLPALNGWATAAIMPAAATHGMAISACDHVAVSAATAQPVKSCVQHKNACSVPSCCPVCGPLVPAMVAARFAAAPRSSTWVSTHPALLTGITFPPPHRPPVPV